MARSLEVIYEQGILRPLQPLDLAEHQRNGVMRPTGGSLPVATNALY